MENQKKTQEEQEVRGRNTHRKTQSSGLLFYNGLKNRREKRRMEDILIACVGGLPDSHRRLLMLLPAGSNIKPLMADLKWVYTAPASEKARSRLDALKIERKVPEICEIMTG